MLEKKIRIISAGAGSGKTHRLTEELAALLNDAQSGIRPEGIVATTFTRKASAELVERLRQSLFSKGRSTEAEKLAAGYIGTVNSVCGALLQKVAFEAGISPQLEVIADEDQQVLFNKALAEVVNDERVDTLDEIGERCGGLDWKESLKTIIDAARGNNIPPTALKKFARKSLAELKKFIPKQSRKSADTLDAALLASISAAIPAIRKNSADTTKITQGYLEELEGYELRLRSGTVLPWTDWVGLATKSPAKKSAALAEPVQESASRHNVHPRFHDDLEQYITIIFLLAEDVIEHFQTYKSERGLIDFVDQEALFLQALELPEVRERLSQELDLLLVDEFQDTSPIQLALFLRMTELVKQAVWVGDPKQSIYAFRGADPALMAAVCKEIPVKAGDIQTNSYRSRPDLVRFVNGLFVPALADILPRKQVELQPVRTDSPEAGPALQLWPLTNGNKGLRTAAIADGIVGLIASAPIIHDKPAGKERTVRAGDIAVLCRSHDACRDLAQALVQRGVKVAIGRPGLMETPEGKLVIACLRYFLNRYDTLANAEIQVLTAADPRPEEWLVDRISWLAAKNKSDEWGADHGVLAALGKLADRAIEFSPSEVLDEIVETVNLRRLLIGWGDRERRLGNLENLRLLAQTYEDSCLRQMSAATLSGFLLWLSDLADAEKDNQAEGYGADTVSIVTCHSSKGLEWPIVVVANLDTDLRERIWGVTVCDDRKEILLSSPLAERWIRFWPWPYGKKSVNTGLKEAMQGSKVFLDARKSAEAEDLRLLYVTLTRARDYLVLCLNGKGTPWLNLALDKAKLVLPDLDHDKVLAVAWDKSRIKLKFQVCVPKAAEPADSSPASEIWLPERTGRSLFSPAKLNPSTMDVPDGTSISIGKPVITGRPLTLNGKPSYDILGTALHGIFAVGAVQEMPPNRRIALLEGMLSRFGVAGAIESIGVLENCDGFYKFIAQFRPTRILTEWPLQMRIGEQLLIGTADMILDTERGWIVIDHKSYPGPKTLWAKESEGYAGQLQAYADAVREATGRPVVGKYIHFVVGGGVVEVV